MAPYISYAGGYLTNPDATANCNFCSISSTNTFLAAFNIHYSDRWTDFGLMWVYIIFNVCAALGLYWLARVVSWPTDRFQKQGS
jgi:ATP-binding cassette, subfamily G (WHITE), member 2, PDR